MNKYLTLICALKLRGFVLEKPDVETLLSCGEVTVNVGSHFYDLTIEVTPFDNAPDIEELL